MNKTQEPQTTNYEKPLLISTILLMTLGIIFIYASSALKSLELFQHPFYFVQKQVVGVLISLGLILIIRRVPLSLLARGTLPLLLFSLVSLGLIFIPNLYREAGGASRWLALPFFSFQPAELAKLALVFFLAKNLTRKSVQLDSFAKGTLPNLLILVALSACLLKQPDFGSTVVLSILTISMIFMSGAPRRFVFFPITLGVCAFSYFVLSEPYRLKRLVSFLNPWEHSATGGFQIIQSYLAFQNGGFWGTGLGTSKQKLFFLPEAHTDFILSVVGEEVGLFGMLIVYSLYLYIILIGFRIASSQQSSYYSLLAFGLTTMFAIQSTLNAFVVTGLLPTKGLPLPFLSSGITSLVTFSLVMGVLMNITRSKKAPQNHGSYYQ